MHKKIDKLFEKLWDDYVLVTPLAHKIHELLGSTQKDDIINDHIALRTFNIEKINLEKISLHFKALGYKECGEYNFDVKKLHAKHFEHPNPSNPKVFISELLVEEFSPQLQKIIKDLVDQVDEEEIQRDDFLYSGTKWSLNSSVYNTLLQESEYAAWTAAWGNRANHFTVNINHLSEFKTIEEVNTKLKNAGFVLNTSGGEIKGTPEVFLEQSSTMADKYNYKFSDCEMEIPSCFYEFALRYKKPDGKIYTGFVTASADKIFESTNTK